MGIKNHQIDELEDAIAEDPFSYLDDLAARIKIANEYLVEIGREPRPSFELAINEILKNLDEVLTDGFDSGCDSE